MKMRFVTAIKTTESDATAWHKSLPRAMRKAKRLVVPTGKPQAYTSEDVDTYMQTEYRVDTYCNQNLEFLDRGHDFDEFQDIDNEHEGMTIVEPDSVLATIRFLNGYNII